MSIKTPPFWSLILVGLILFSCDENKKSESVAKFTGGSISVDQFEKDYIAQRASGSKKNASSSSMQQKEAFLKDMIEDVILKGAIDACQFDTISGNAKQREDLLYSFAIQKRLFENDIKGKFITEEALKDFYGKMKNEYRAQHILIKDSINVANEVLAKIKSGEIDFKAAVKKYSKDPSTTNNGGDLGWFSVSKMVPTFGEAVSKSKKGDILGPVKTMFGYHLIKVNDIRKNKDLKSYAEEKASLKQKFSMAKRKEIMDYSEVYLDSAFVEYGVEINDSNAQIFSDIYNNSKTISEDGKQLNPLSKIDESTKNLVIIKSQFDTIHIRDIVDPYKDYPVSKMPIYSNKESVLRVAKGSIIRDVLYKKVDDLGYSKDAELIEEVDKRMQDRYRALFRKKIYSRASVTDKEIKDYYEEHKKEKYKNRQFKNVQFTIKSHLISRKKQNIFANWRDSTYNANNVIIDYPILERTFSVVEDDKK